MAKRIDPKAILRRVQEEGFEAVWRESADYIPTPKKRQRITAGKRGTPHPLFDLIQRLRKSFLDLGFMEVSNPMIVDENEIYKQYGPEAPIILDRCYFLATLPRPDIGLSQMRCREIENCGVELTGEKIRRLQRVLRDYKRGEIEPDDMVERFSEALEVPDVTAMLVISRVFPEFASLKPEPTTLTFRSHITTAWFLTLQAVQHRMELPIELFTVDVRLRREQREDATHLRVHHAASCVVMDEKVDVNLGREITRRVLEPLGFERFRFVQKKVTSKYYTPGMEYEGFIYHRGMKSWIEVVNYGLYNSIALARYDLEHPVLNLGIGVERVAMALHGEGDVRRLVYPQFYTELSLSDVEIAGMIRYDREPETEEGMRIKERIIAKAIEHTDAEGPCEILTYEGTILGKRVKVYLYEAEAGAKLLGAAARNQVYIYDGNIVGVPLEGMEDVKIIREAKAKGTPTKIDFLGGIAALAAAQVEEALKTGRKEVNIRVRMVNSPRDVNIRISEVVRRYVTGRKKKIAITGPVFIGIRANITDQNHS
ncbi:MAG: O-phosphoserine--tRNA ligase [Candidatus Bathyarchaeia archaeon]